MKDPVAVTWESAKVDSPQPHTEHLKVVDVVSTIKLKEGRKEGGECGAYLRLRNHCRKRDHFIKQSRFIHSYECEVP